MDKVEQLLVVQERDTRIRQMQQELRDIPARKASEQERLEEHRRLLAQAEEQLKAEQVKIKELEVEVGSRRDRIAKLRQQQMELKTNKEFRAMEHEIVAVEEEITGLEDQELVLMEDSDRARREVKARQDALKQEDAAVAEDMTALDARAAGIEEQLREVEVQRAEAAVGIDPEWLSRYDAIRTRRPDAVAHVEGNFCGGCHMQLPPFVIHDTKKKDVMVSCTHCGRLLY